MSVYKYVVRLPSVTGLPRDQFMNTFYIDQTVAGPLASGAIQNFYVTRATGSVNATSAYMSQAIASGTNVAHIDQYDIPDDFTGPAGPPISTIAFNWPTIGVGSPLPNEVCAAIALHADLTGVPEHAGTSRPRARLRGRFFVGPLNTTAITQLTTAPKLVVLEAQFRQDLVNQTKTLAAAVGAGKWMILSRHDHAVHPIVGGWVDDAPDTQRRRGQDATTRTTFTIP